MNLVAIINAVGGAGATTVASHLATAVTQQNKPALCFDFCPTNVLRLHFGAALADEEGFATALLAGRPWQDAAYTSASGVRFLPFGALEHDAALEQTSAWMQARPGWFASALARIELAPGTLVICDCPRLPAALRSQVVEAARMVIVVCTPDPLALASATRLARQLDAGAERRSAILLNRFDAARVLDRDMRLLLRRQSGTLAVPVVIPQDEALREALACKQTVYEYAPAAPAAQEFSALATWVMARSVQSVTSA